MSERPSSKMARSSKPSSKMPQNDDEPQAPRSRVASRKEPAPARYSMGESNLDSIGEEDEEEKEEEVEEEEEEEEEEDKQDTLAPLASRFKSMAVGNSSKVKSRAPRSTMPQSTSPLTGSPGSAMPASSPLSDNRAKSTMSTAGSAMPGSKLFSDKRPQSAMAKAGSLMPGSSLFSDKRAKSAMPKAGSAMPASQAFSDKKPKAQFEFDSLPEMKPKKPASAIPRLSSAVLSSQALHEPSSRKPRSVFSTSEDRIRSQMQSSFAALPAAEQEPQKKWAVEMIKRSGACPEGYDWTRQDAEGYEGGFVCAGGRHGVLDSQIALGTGGVVVLRGDDWAGPKWGPYFAHPDFRNVWLEIEEPAPVTLPGVDFCKRRVIFLGSDNQRERAKWEFYAAHPEAARRFQYERPAKEPPVECRDDDQNQIRW